MADNMAKIRARAFQIFLGEVIVTGITAIVTLAFIGSGLWTIVKNVIIFDLIFLLIYIIWLKLFCNYEKIYKAGLKED